jgi:hypothetical protein
MCSIVEFFNIDDLRFINIDGVKPAVDDAQTKMPGIIIVRKLNVLGRGAIREIRTMTTKRKPVNMPCKFGITIGCLQVNRKLYLWICNIDETQIRIPVLVFGKNNRVALFCGKLKNLWEEMNFKNF